MLELKASSCIAHAGLIPINVLDISVDNNSVCLSKSSRLYANNVQITDDSYNLLNPPAIESLNSSASILFCAKILSLLMFPLSAATILSDSISLILLFNSFCDVFSVIGLMKTDILASPKVYILLKNSGKVHILGIVEIIILRAYFVVLATISIWFVCVASTPAGEIISLRLFLFFFKMPFSSSIFFSISFSFGFCLNNSIDLSPLINLLF